MINNTTSFLLARFAVAASMFGHGLVRLPKIYMFSHAMAANFQKSILPQALVLPFGYMLPVAEFCIGLLLLAGLFMKQALAAGTIVMILLIFGSCMVEDWGSLPSQLIHVLFFTLLISHLQYNSFSVDTLMKK